MSRSGASRFPGATTKLALLALLLAAPLVAQTPTNSWPSWAVEGTAGAAQNLLLRGPWITPSWRKPIPRALLAAGTSLAYERFLDQRGFSWGDVAQRAVSYGVIEVLVALIRSRP